MRPIHNGSALMGNVVQPPTEVDRHFIAALPAQQLVDGHAQRLPLDIPQRHVNGAHRPKFRPIVSVIGRLAEHPLIDPFDVRRISSDQSRAERLDACLGRALQSVIGLPQSGDPLVRMDQGPVIVPPILLIRLHYFHLGDLHISASSPVNPRVNAPINTPVATVSPPETDPFRPFGQTPPAPERTQFPNTPHTFPDKITISIRKPGDQEKTLSPKCATALSWVPGFPIEST